MSKVYTSADQLVGKTPLLELVHIEKAEGLEAKVLGKLERIADHCSNIAGCVVQMQKSRLDIHGYLDGIRSGSDEYRQRYDFYARKYALV